MKQKVTTITVAALFLAGWLVLMALVGPLLDKAAAAVAPTISTADLAIHPGDVVEVPVILSSAPAGLAGFDISVEVSGDAVEITGASADFGLTDISITTSTAVRIFAVDLNESVNAGSTLIELAIITVRGLQSGTASLEIAVFRLEDEKGNPIDHTVIAGVITVSMPVLPGQLEPVADLDGDGIAEDLNGNGRFDFQDIILLFENFATIQPQDVAIFDFDGNGLLGFNDVVSMFQRLLRPL